MIYNILTLFPETLSCFFRESILKRAIEKGVVEVRLVNIRDYSADKHKKVDDYPFGGGSGMVVCPDPLFRAVESIEKRGKVVYLSPRGSLLNQDKIRELSASEALTMICGHYEGVDNRVIEHLVDEEISIGDYVLTGGELAAAIVVDAVTRMLDTALGNSDSRLEESFDSTGLLEYEHYTRPANYRGYEVPPVLLSGNHMEIQVWRLKRRVINTLRFRPDLLKRADLSPDVEMILREISKENDNEHCAGN